MIKEDTDVNKLWEIYKKEKSLKVKHELILHYIWLVKYVIQLMNLPVNAILDEDDFVNIGILGLHESLERFEIERGVKFESYAIPRIKGIIQDELRRLDWLSRSARKKASDFMQATDSLRSSEGREVSPEEIMQKLNVTPEEYKSYLAAAAAAKGTMTLSEPTRILVADEETDILEEFPDTDQESMLSQIENEERTEFISKYLNSITEKKRLVITLYYYESLTFKEIGQVLNVSESRVCQIHTQVLGDLRIKLNEFDNA